MGIEQGLRETVKATTEGKVNPNDPIFIFPPSSKQTSKTIAQRVTIDIFTGKTHGIFEKSDHKSLSFTDYASFVLPAK